MHTYTHRLNKTVPSSLCHHWNHDLGEHFMPQKPDFFFSLMPQEGGDSLIVMNYGVQPPRGLVSMNIHMLIFSYKVYIRHFLTFFIWLWLSRLGRLPALLPLASRPEQFNMNSKNKHWPWPLRACRVWCVPASPASFLLGVSEVMSSWPLAYC